MNVHVFRHVPFEGAGSIARWASARGGRLGETWFWDDVALPSVEGLDLLVVMGGPMSVNDEAEFPWLRAEKQFIGKAIEHGVPVLGVCLGAQLIASVLGARVYRQAEKEIGWFPIRRAAAGEGCGVAADDRFSFPEELTVFHWHGETFDLPAGAVRLASSPPCPNQAFRYGDRVLALQFHLEVTPEGARDLVENCRSDLAPGRYVQPEPELLAAPATRFRENQALLDRLLDALVRP